MNLLARLKICLDFNRSCCAMCQLAGDCAIDFRVRGSFMVLEDGGEAMDVEKSLGKSVSRSEQNGQYREREEMSHLMDLRNAIV